MSACARATPPAQRVHRAVVVAARPVRRHSLELGYGAPVNLTYPDPALADQPQRAPGAAPHSGHHCSNQTARSLTADTRGAEVQATPIDAQEHGLEWTLRGGPQNLMHPRCALSEVSTAVLLTWAARESA